ncbi:hypothetical protein AVEN_103433-1 [Araneus ventricosus]|uniref:Retrovirus-related Pol polyprotein from transposon TNT 1-94 n=1 Tax=Araneus ventricosus TaxID=182803 RepID=A0A4Y2H6Y3_ARAVE|nr:hypothetical protein AVEN_103433-1 [Araneus ventricosus]
MKRVENIGRDQYRYEAVSILQGQIAVTSEKDSYRIWVPDKNDVVFSRDTVFKDEIMSEKASIEIVQTQSTEEVCEEDASCIDAGEETEAQNIDDLNTLL